VGHPIYALKYCCSKRNEFVFVVITPRARQQVSRFMFTCHCRGKRADM